MSGAGERAWERHPLCTCPELTWDAATGLPTMPDVQACRDRSPFVDTHPVLDAEDLRVITRALRGKP